MSPNYVDLESRYNSEISTHDSESLTERVVLQASPGIVRCINRLVLARRKEMRGRYAIDCPLKNGGKVFFGIRMRYLERGSGGDSGG